MSGSFAKGLVRRFSVMVLMTALAGAAALAQSPYASDMQAGREAFDGSNYALAERYFRGAYENAQSDGQKATALYSLAVAAQKQGKVEEARQHANKALEHSPKNNQAKRLLEELAAAAERAPAKGRKEKQRAEAGKPPEPKSEPVAATKPAEKTAQAVLPPAAAAAEKPAAQMERPQTKRAALATARESRVTDEPAGGAAGVETAALPSARGSEAAASSAAPQGPSGSAAAPPLPVENEVIRATVAASLPEQPLPTLGAGFSVGATHVVVLTGRTGPAEKADGTLELRKTAIAPGETTSEVFALHSDVAAGHLAVSPSGTLVASAVPLAGAAGRRGTGKGGVATIHIWDLAAIENTHAIELPIADVGDLPAGLEALAFSRNGRRLVVAHRTGLEILDTNGLRSAGSYRFPPRQRVDGRDAPIALAVSATGRHVVLANGTRLRVVDGTSVRDLASTGGKGVFERVALSDDGRLIAAASGATTRFFDLASGREVTPALPDAAGRVTALAFSPGSDRIAVAAADGVRVWKVAGRKLVIEAPEAASAEHLAFSADGTLLLAAAKSGIRVLRLSPAVAASQTDIGPGQAKASPATETLAPAKVASAAAGPVLSTAERAEPKPAASEVPSPGATQALPAADAAAPAPAKAPLPAADDSAARSGERTDVAMSNPVPLVETRQAAAPAAMKPSLAELNSARAQALAAGDCERVRQLDAELGGAGQHGACLERQAQQSKVAERARLVAEHKAALERLDCAAAKSIDEKLGLGDERALATCTFEALIKTGSAREMFLAAARHDADHDRGPAKRLYRAIVDRFPDDDLAIKAAERMTAIADQEAAGSQPKPRATRSQQRP